MGWAAGIERIMLAGDAQPAAAPVVQLFLALDDQPRARAAAGEDVENGPPAGGRDGSREEVRRVAFELLGEARSAGLTAQMELQGRSLKGQLGHADALGARYVAIVSPDGEAVLKDMQGGGQERLAANAVVHAVLRGLHDL